MLEEKKNITSEPHLRGRTFLNKPSTTSLGPQQLFDQIAWHAVEKQADHDQHQQSHDDLDDEPLVAVAYQISYGLQRTQKPKEGGVRTAVMVDV